MDAGFTIEIILAVGQTTYTFFLSPSLLPPALYQFFSRYAYPCMLPLPFFNIAFHQHRPLMAVIIRSTAIVASLERHTLSDSDEDM